MPEITFVTYLSFWVATLVAGFVGAAIGIGLSMPFVKNKITHVEQLKGQILSLEDKLNEYIGIINALRNKQINLLDSQCVLFVSMAKKMPNVFRLNNDAIIYLDDVEYVWQFPEKFSHLLDDFPQFKHTAETPLHFEIIFSRENYEKVLKIQPGIKN